MKAKKTAKKISLKAIATYLVLALFVVWLGLKFFSEEEIEEAPPPPVTISQEELHDFLGTWSDYLSSNISKKDIKYLSLSDGEVPKRTVDWLKKRNWKADRFFYVEQRVKSIIRSAYLREHSQKTIDILQSQLKTEKDKQIVDNIKNLIDIQSKNFNVENVTEEEIEMIARDIMYINDILEGNMVLKK